MIFWTTGRISADIFDDACIRRFRSSGFLIHSRIRIPSTIDVFRKSRGHRLRMFLTLLSIQCWFQSHTRRWISEPFIRSHWHRPTHVA